MSREWTFGRKVALGLAASVAFTVVIGAIAVRSLHDVVASKDELLSVYVPLLLDAEKLRSTAEATGRSSRGYLLAAEARFLNQMQASREEFRATLARLHEKVLTEDGHVLISAIEKAEIEHQAGIDRVVALRRNGASIQELGRALDEQVVPRRTQLEEEIDAFAARESRLLEEAKRASSDRASSAIGLTLLIALAAAVVAAAMATVLVRSLSRDIGSAIGQVQSSSAELQSTAGQQATGAREQATAMSEISTTISELLVTSRQIADSARQVTAVAAQSATLAAAGEAKVQTASESIAAIRRQVDLVVGHMLGLGKKSQQIGGVVEIVSELAEQTNILAINATIEAAGAGESGRRFAVVADEIRKLADRVAASAKEIRELIEDVRSSVNSTVMATESGSKAVDTGTRQFGDAADGFRQIAGQVLTTSEAAREIELSTKQQTTAVEQVNLAMTSVAQAAREGEASTGQTLQTASQLAALSRELMRLVRAEAGG